MIYFVLHTSFILARSRSVVSELFHASGALENLTERSRMFSSL